MERLQLIHTLNEMLLEELPHRKYRLPNEIAEQAVCISRDIGTVLKDVASAV